MAVSTVKRAGTVKIRARLTKPGLSLYMIGWRAVAVMTGIRSVIIAAV